MGPATSLMGQSSWPRKLKGRLSLRVVISEPYIEHLKAETLRAKCANTESGAIRFFQ